MYIIIFILYFNLKNYKLQSLYDQNIYVYYVKIIHIYYISEQFSYEEFFVHCFENSCSYEMQYLD